MGAVQAEQSCDIIHHLKDCAAETDGARILRQALPYNHPDYPQARTMTPLVVSLPSGNAAFYAQEHFGPVLFIIAACDGATAVNEACFLAREHGAISSYLYSTDEAFIDAALDNYTRSGMNLSVNLHGGMWANFAAAYSDYHVTGLNPAGNACLTDLAFVANRFRIVQHRRPAPRTGEKNGA
jgi:acyl-CoA reductase-like NAD-dependent aldehyde dehydrogenase